MGTVILLIITHIAAFVAGAVVFRNNSSKIADAINNASAEVSKVEGAVKDAKSEFENVKNKL